MSACPWGECPVAPHPCGCWEPAAAGVLFSAPEPCEGCWIWTANYRACDGSCTGHSDRQWKKRCFGPAWDGRQLIKNGRKP